MRARSLLLRRIGIVGSLGAVAAASLVACNVVVGVGDFAVGTGAEAGDGGFDATTSDASPLGDAGGEAGGDGGAGCGSSFPTTAAFKQLVQSCVLAAGCTGRLAANSISTCITTHEFASNTNNSDFTCLAGVTDCKGVTTCTGLGWATTSECPTTVSSIPAGHCSDGGATAINCLNGTGTTTNCPTYAGSAQCGVHVGPNDAGTFAECIVEECKPDAGTAVHCDESSNTLVECYGDAGFGAVCSATRSQCETYGGVTGCYYAGPTSCTTPGVVQCTGPTTETLCADTSTILTGDCAAAGGTCVTSGASAACVSPGCTFQQSTTTCKESCANDGVTANFCIGGAPYPVRCTDYPDFSLGGCVVQNNGYATCVP